MPHPGRTQKISRAQATQALPRKLSAADQKWVERTLRKMTLEEKLGQLLVVYYFGGFVSADSAEYQQLMRAVEDKRVGGFVVQTHGSPLGIERSQVYPTAILANLLQTHAKIPLLVAADFERGTAMRLDEGTSFPHAMAVGATGRPEDAYTMGKVTTLEARAVGAPWIFAPVADVNSNPDNPIINTRSFGEDPQKVAEFVTQFVRGVQENGGLATAKHFPGHGDTSVDSHMALPIVPYDLAHLEKVELSPFRAAIAAGVGSIMTGHLAVPAVEANKDIPATLSAKITTDLLRKQMGFGGLVVTDALDMAGVTSLYSPPEVAVRAIQAGADMLLVPPVPDAALAGLREAVAAGRIPMSQIDEAVTRILRTKARLGLSKNRFVDIAALPQTFGRPEFARQALDITDRGVTLLRDTQHLFPLDATRPLRVLLAAIAGDPDPYPGEDLEREIRWRVDSLQAVRCDTRFVRADTVKLPAPDSYDVAIAALFVRVADRKGTVGLPDDEAALVNQLLSTGKPTVVASFGSPYLIARFPAAQTWLATFSNVDVAQKAAGRAMFGQVAIGGRLPVSVPGAAQLGAGLNVPANPMKVQPAGAEVAVRLQPAFDVLDRAVADHAFPGGVLAVGYRNSVVVHAFGRQTYAADAPAILPDTIYDAASLTKAVATTALAGMLVEAGRLQLDAPIERYLPEWTSGPQPEWRHKAAVRNLLTHTSGLPTHRDFFEVAKNRAFGSQQDKRAVLARVFAEPLDYEPGTKAEYSDLGFMLLGEIIERLTGKPLDVLSRERIFAPLGMEDTLFNPPKSLRARIAPTESDEKFRMRLIQGEVHDENAWAMGGVAGHAGMFTTAGDLAAFCQMMLNGGIYAHQRLLRRATVQLFTSPEAIAGGTRALGWTVPTTGSSSGKYFSAQSYGHTGFTGTSIWIDPEKQLFVVLLTNRVHPTRENEKIQQVRPAVHDAIVEALGLTLSAQPVPPQP